jgi:hypothetical protein
MPLMRFRGTGNTTIPVSTQDPLPVAVVSGGGGGGPASDVTIVGVQSGVVFNTAIGSVASGVTVPIVLNSVASGVTVPIALNSVASGVTVPIALANVASGVTVPIAISSVASGVTVPIVLNSVASGVTVPIAISSVASGVTVPVTGRMRMETVSQSATFSSGDTSANITVSGQNLHDFGGCILHYELTNTYTVRLHGWFTAGGQNAGEMVVAEATGITGRGFIVLPTFHVPNLRVEFVRTSGTTSGQTNRVFIVLTPSMPV